MVGGIILTLLVLILLKNRQDKKDFYASLHAAEDQTLMAAETGSDQE